MTRRNRRQFLEDSMFATAAAVAAGSTVRVRAEENTESTSPVDKLSVAVVGVNGRGKSHLDAFVRRSDCDVTHICDADANIGQSQVEKVAARQQHQPKFVQDVRKLLEDDSIDIVTIATPNHWHALGAIWAMQAGKDVYLEKPVSHNVFEGRVIVDVARQEGKICQTGTQCRSNPGMQQAMEFVHSGGIGDVKVARGLCYKGRASIGDRGEYSVPSSVDYSLWLGPAQMQPVTRKRFHYDWHWQWPYGNGDLGNQGIHQMDLARWGLGVDRLSDSVFSYGGRFGYEDAGDTANTQVVVHTYGDKSLVFEVRGLSTAPYRGAKVGVIFEGADGYVVMTSYHSGAAFDLSGNKIRDFNEGGDHYANFVDAVRSRKHQDLNADILEGHLSSALCHLGNISYRLSEEISSSELASRLDDLKVAEDTKATLKRTVDHLGLNSVDTDAARLRLGPNLEFDATTEVFTRSKAANSMLTRDYREPFVVRSPQV